MIRTINLHGRLGQLFGKTHQLDVDSVAEAMRALDSQLPGFRDYVTTRKYLITTGSGAAIGEKQLSMSLGSSGEINVIPAAMVSGLETILLVGALLFVAAAAVMVMSMPKAPKAANREEATKTDSFIFDGPQNSTEQGHPVPLVYGRFEVGSIIVSAGITTADVNQTSLSNPFGFIGTTPGISGSPAGNEWVVLEKGGKAGGGSTPRAAQEDPNSLQSKAVARILEVVSEGEIVGLVDGLKSIKFDGTPVQNVDDSYNFAGLAVEQRVGLPDQDYMPGFPQTENTISVDQRVKVLTGPVVRTIDDANATLAYVTLKIPQLYVQDTSNGDIRATSVEMGIDLQIDDGGYYRVVNCLFQGKTNSGYERTYEIRLPPGTNRQIRVLRVSPDADVASVSNETWWTSYTEVVEAKLSYPNTAMIGITIDARQFGSSIPTRSYDIKGLIIEVPTNYDPESRTYTGLWDGTFKRAWSDNPAWVLRDIVVNRRYGLGARVPASGIDKWQLYTIAQYCDQMVPDGFGGTQPRYTINCAITSEASAYDLLASIASNFRAWTYWGSGSVIVIQDRPEDPSVVVTPANVVGGKIKYNRVTSLDKRRSVAIVYWNDPDDNYRLTPEVYEDPDLIRRFGRRTGDEVTAFGVTNRGQAHRVARWLLEDESQGSNSLASYDAGEDHAFVGPGHVVSLEDPMFSGLRRGGRLLTASANQVTLDRPFTLSGDQSYTLRTVLPNGSIVRRAITNSAGEVTTLTLSGSPYNPVPLPGAVWTIESDQVVNRQFRIRARGGDRAPYEVQAVLHDPTKYERVEEARDLSTLPFLSLPEGGLVAPSGLTIAEFLYRDGDATIPSVQVSWTASPDPRVTFYQAQFQRPDGQFEGFADSLDTSREIRGTVPGWWVIRVRAVDSLGRKTEWVQKSFELVAGSGALPHVTGLQLIADEDAITPLLHWTVAADPRPLKFRVYYNATSNTIGSATAMGETSSLLWPVSAPGHYWVASFFTSHEDTTPPHIEITPEMFAEVKWSRVLGRPTTLDELDSVAAAAIDTIQDDIADLYSSLGSSSSAAASAAAAAASAAAADAAKTAAQTAQTAAGTSATSAAGSATSAANSATAAGNSATSASGSANTATTKANDASSSASAASTSASAASTSASSAGTYATAASNSASAASVSAGNASSSATTSTSQAAIATAQAAAAQSSAVLAASITPNYRNKNPNFAVWNSSTSPESWWSWVGTAERVAGPTAQYAMKLPGPAGASAGYSTNYQMPFSPGWWVTEVEVTLNAGSFKGVYSHCHSYSGASSTGDYSVHSVYDSVGAGVVGRTYRISFLRQWTTACDSAYLYAMSHWGVGGTAGDISTANEVTWSLCGIRPASPQEIRDQTVLAPLEATVSSHSGVLATHDGKLQAYLALTAAAGSSAAAVRLVADSYAGSLLELQADAIRLGAANLPAMAIVGGQVYFYGKVTAGSISATELSSGTLITNSAQIGSGVIETANIGSAQITGALIHELTVDTIHIVNGSLTSMTALSNFTPAYYSGAWTEIMSLSVYSTGRNMTLSASAQIQSQVWPGTNVGALYPGGGGDPQMFAAAAGFYVRLTIDGSVVSPEIYNYPTVSTMFVSAGEAGSWNSVNIAKSDLTLAFVRSLILAEGYHTVKIETYGAVYVSYRTLVVLENKK